MYALKGFLLFLVEFKVRLFSLLRYQTISLVNLNRHFFYLKEEAQWLNDKLFSLDYHLKHDKRCKEFMPYFNSVQPLQSTT